MSQDTSFVQSKEFQSVVNYVKDASRVRANALEAKRLSLPPTFPSFLMLSAPIEQKSSTTVNTASTTASVLKNSSTTASTTTTLSTSQSVTTAREQALKRPRQNTVVDSKCRNPCCAAKPSSGTTNLTRDDDDDNDDDSSDFNIIQSANRPEELSEHVNVAATDNRHSNTSKKKRARTTQESTRRAGRKTIPVRIAEATEEIKKQLQDASQQVKSVLEWKNANESRISSFDNLEKQHLALLQKCDAMALLIAEQAMQIRVFTWVGDDKQPPENK